VNPKVSKIPGASAPANSREATIGRRRTTPDRSPDNRSLQRGMELLRAFRPGAETLGNGELAERCGLSRATVSRLTQTLLRAGFLEHDAEHRLYRLGAPVLSLAHARRAGSTLLQVAAAPMRALSENMRVNVGLALADRDDMVYLESIRYNRRAAQRNIVAGQRVPIELTSLGHAWLAVSPEARDALYPVFARRRANWNQIQQEIELAIDAVEQRGWCWAAWQPEVVAVSTPLRFENHPVHVLNVSTTSTLASATVAERLAPHLMALADQLIDAMSRARED